MEWAHYLGEMGPFSRCRRGAVARDIRRLSLPNWSAAVGRRLQGAQSGRMGGVAYLRMCWGLDSFRGFMGLIPSGLSQVCIPSRDSWV
jgi:hypothetical protein